MDAHQTYCGKLFIIYASQITMLYTSNVYSAICQLYLNKTKRRKKEKSYTGIDNFARQNTHVLQQSL